MSRDTRNVGLAYILSLAIVITASLSARVLLSDVKTVTASESHIMTPAK